MITLFTLFAVILGAQSGGGEFLIRHAPSASWWTFVITVKDGCVIELKVILVSKRFLIKQKFLAYQSLYSLQKKIQKVAFTKNIASTNRLSKDFYVFKVEL